MSESVVVARQVRWTTMTGAVVLVVSAVLAVVVRLAGLAAGEGLEFASDLVMSLGCLASTAVFYHGLIHWNRVATLTSEPGDRLNGVCAVLVLAATGNFALDAFGDPDPGLGMIARQLNLLSLGGVFVVLGTCLTVAMMGQLGRDSRIWLFSGCAGVGLSVEAAAALSGGDLWPWRPLVWLGLGLLIARGARMRQVVPETTASSSTQATTTGALAVLVAAGVVLVVVAVFGGSHWSTAYSALAGAGVTVRLFRIVQDLELLARTRAEARTDELTGIANRRGLMAELDGALASRVPVSLLIVDLDRFKVINDRYGHTVGDLLLRHVAERFSGLVPESSLFARLGGDEFALVMPGASQQEAVAVATTLTDAAAEVTDIRGLKLRFGASIGVARGQAPGHDAEELMRRADVAMYLAKGRREGVRVYDPELDTAALEELQLLEDLHRALSEDGLEQIDVFFQPQIAAGGTVEGTAGGTAVGAEALVRWHHPRLGLLSPDRFVDLAEANGLMDRLTMRVLQRAAEETVRWRAAGLPLRVSVNLSPSCLRQPALLPALDAVIAGGVPAEDLVLELTETMLMEDPEHSLAMMRTIAALGVGLSIDDYGTGYSSLGYLTDLPATELKIDQSFTSRVVAEPRTRAVVAGTVELAHRLGMRLVAEGVEDEQTLTAMRELGCDETQGYLHSRPLPADAFLDWLVRQNDRSPSLEPS